MPSVINSDNGVISGTSGLKTSGSNDGLLDFQSNGTRIAGITTSAFQVGTNNISAVNSMGFRNRIINGDMRIDQRNAGASVTVGAGAYPVDRWFAVEDTDGALSAEQVEDAPASLYQSTKITVTTADASLGAAQNSQFRQAIEGYNISDLNWGTANAASVTVSFWVKSSLTGTFGGSLRNATPDRSYIFQYTINAPNTWEYKTVTISGDTSGTWGAGNGVGMYVTFDLGSGTDRNGTANQWQSGSLFRVSGNVSLISTLNATWFVTGVQLEAGSVATPFERRDYGRELMMCQRYFTNWVGDSSGTGFRAIGSGQCANTTTDMNIVIPLSVAMRANPTLSFSGTVFLLDSSATGSLTSIVTTYAASNQSVWGIFRASAGTFTTGRAGIMYTLNGTTNSFSASAEL